MFLTISFNFFCFFINILTGIIIVVLLKQILKKTLKPYFLLLFFVFLSCQYFDKNIPNPEVLADEKLKTIDFSEVTTYPSTQLCDSISDKTLKKDCFFEYISQVIQAKFDEQESTVYTRDKDTLNVLVTVNYHGEINIQAPTTALDKTMFDSLFAIQSAEFPKIYPATKEGVPVSVQFELPVVLTPKN